MKRLTKTATVRFTPREWRAIQAHRSKDDTVSDAIRKLLAVSLTLLAKDEPSPEHSA